MNSFQDFFDFVAINDTLDERPRTTEAFKQLDERDTALAAEVFTLARPSLIRTREYILCGRYLKPSSEWAAAVGDYRLGKAWAKEGRFGPEHTEFTEKRFTNTTATILALLVVNGRQQEANELALEAKREWDDSTFHAAIDSALQGIIPEPYP
jgi:hypothetical protein